MSVIPELWKAKAVKQEGAEFELVLGNMIAYATLWNPISKKEKKKKIMCIPGWFLWLQGI